jgi:CubicO group peptidase (beta-lactamase class C family)
MHAFFRSSAVRLLFASVFLSAASLITLFVSARPVQPAAGANPDLGSSEQEQIDAYLEARMRTANIPGLALGVVRGDEVIYLKGYGIAGPHGRVVTPQTPFIIGSLSKSFTALAVMQLVEAGQIDLDAPVTQYLPWFRTAGPAASAQTPALAPERSAGASVTVRQLLNQNSGLPVYAGRRGFVVDDQSDAALENGVRQLATVTLSHPAGEAFEYANENYTTLGLIIQAVSGRSYEDVIRAKVFTPLQMRHSAAALTDPAAQDLATGYRYWLWWPIAYDAPYPRGQTPAGFLISSAEDMAHYLIAHLNGGAYDGQQVLSPAGLATLHAPGARMGATSAYAMGWVVHAQAGSPKIDHNGDVSNFHGNMLLLPGEKIGIVILTNVDGFSHGAALNVPIEGVAAILQGQSLSAEVDPPLNWLPPTLALLPPLMGVLWLAGSFALFRRWQRRVELPVRGRLSLWRYALPLAVDLGLGGAAWIILPAQFQTPMATIALFAPDVFASVVTLTVLSLAGALGRSLFVFQRRRQLRAAGRQTRSARLPTQTTSLD